MATFNLPRISRRAFFNLLDNRWLNPLRRLIKDEQLRLRDHRPGNRQLLLLSSTQHPTFALGDAAQNREQLENVGGDGIFTSRFSRCRGAKTKVFLHGEMGKDSASLGNVADAVACAQVCGTAGYILS